jgi:hypothetical protein
LVEILEGDAQDWNEDKANDIKHCHKRDEWKAFSSAMKKKFINILFEEKY